MVKIARKLPNGKADSIYVDGYLNEILDFYRTAIEKHKTSVVLIFDGRSGMGKTTLNNQIGIILDPNYDLHKIFYTPETFLEALSLAKPGDYLCFDEAMLLSNRSSLTEINRMVIIAMSMIRSKRIYVSFCVNSIFDIDKNIAISRADILLHVYGDNLIDRGKYAAFFKAKGDEDRLKKLYLFGKKFYDYSRPKANFVGSFASQFVVDEIEYEKRKQKGVNDFLKGSEKTTGRKKDEVIKKAVIKLINDGYTQVEIGETLGMSQGRVSQIVAESGKVSVLDISFNNKSHQNMDIIINKEVEEKKLELPKQIVPN